MFIYINLNSAKNIYTRRKFSDLIFFNLACDEKYRIQIDGPLEQNEKFRGKQILSLSLFTVLTMQPCCAQER